VTYVIRCLDVGAGARHAGPNVIGHLLRAYDPEAYEGRGAADWTRIPEDAMMFEAMSDAFILWRTIPQSRPVREDGAPNRPLTAFSVEIIPLEDAI
jgi:hypothetical protein